jgi:hypothetical protein
VKIVTQADNATIALVIVNDNEDAQYLIGQFHRKKIGYKRIHMALAGCDTATVTCARFRLCYFGTTLYGNWRSASEH